MLFKRLLFQRSDEELMELMQSNAGVALDEIYRRYSVRLLRYFHRMLWKEEATAQDFLQDLFLKVLEQHQKFDTGFRFSTWLYSIAHNMCKNEYRKRAFRNSVGMKEVSAAAEIEWKQPDIISMMDGVSFRAKLDFILETFPDEDKSAFVLRYESGLEIKEIAAILSMPEGSVKSKLFYLKRKLAKNLYAYKLTFE